MAGRADESFIDQRVKEHVYSNKDQKNDVRIGTIIMFALDFYSRPYLIANGYSEKEAYDLWTVYMAEEGDIKLFDEISDFDGSRNYM